MPTQTFRSGEQGEVHVDPSRLEAFRQRFQGRLLEPATAGYDEARRVWNAMIDRRPALIAQCQSGEDVRQAILFARESHVVVSVRAGGHNIAGYAVCDGGLMIDLSRMKAIRVDPTSRRVVVQPGVTLGELDAATQAHGWMTPLGINSTTGVAGLTLGGGFGWTSRKFGLSLDNLVSAEVVTAAGKTLRASLTENADLFWALRGGGGNFGVVTSFEFALHPLGPEVLAGLVIHPFSNARPVLEQYRTLTAGAPDEVTCWTVLRRAPPLPFLAAQHHGEIVVVLAMLYAGPVEEGRRALEPLRKIGSPLADAVSSQPFVAYQSLFDPLLVAGERNYWKSNNFRTLEDGLFDALLRQAAKLPTFGCELFLGQLGGAISRSPMDATAYAQRDAAFALNVHGRWESPQQDQIVMDWARETYRLTLPFASGGVYVNFLTQDEANRVPAAYGPNHQRLTLIKRKYDPDNFFRHNQNIPPAAHP